MAFIYVNDIMSVSYSLWYFICLYKIMSHSSSKQTMSCKTYMLISAICNQLSLQTYCIIGTCIPPTLLV